jgi:hypothetical protein
VPGFEQSAMPKDLDFDGAFKGLRRLLKAYAPKLSVKLDTPDNYYLETKDVLRKGARLFVAAVQKKKNYVSLHLITIYMYPDLLRGLSPELKRRKQGKACFNFTAPDPKLFAELDALIDAGFKAFKKRGLPV